MYKNLRGVSDTAQSDKVYVIKAGSRMRAIFKILVYLKRFNLVGAKALHVKKSIFGIKSSEHLAQNNKNKNVCANVNHLVYSTICNSTQHDKYNNQQILIEL